MSAATITHGTYAGYQAERKSPDLTPCAACRKANREYHQQHRQKSPARLDRESRYSSARSRALTRLAALHPAVYAALLDEELSR